MTEPLPAETYARAEQLLGGHRPRLALRARVAPQWIGDGDDFWYRVQTERGAEFVRVAPDAGTRRPAFDHERLAAGLQATVGHRVEPDALPFDSITVEDGAVAFEAFDRCWRCDLRDYACEPDDGRRPRSPLEVGSPDGRWVAFRRGDDVWVRDAQTGEEHALTDDGTADESYAATVDAAGNRHLLAELGVAEKPPALLWSPDSTRILTHRTDQREVAPLHLVEAAPRDGGRPRLHTYRYAMPGEPTARGEWLILDVTGGGVRAVGEPFDLLLFSPIVSGRVWWATDGRAVYHLSQTRDQHTLRLVELDAASGRERTLIEEHGPTRVDAAQELVQKPNVHVLGSGREALWYSQRDGWGHLYRYDLTAGGSAVQLTRGAFAVQQIAHVDETDRVAHLVVSGLVADDPYRRSLVSVGLDDGRLVRLTDDELDHAITAPAHGRWFVDSASTVDTPPVISVRGRDGAVLVELERADVSPLLAAGWSPPERVRTVAADGTTPIWGVLYRPHGFDPDRRYPVLDHPYPGPQTRRVPAAFDCGAYGYDAEAAAALGFAVIAVDGRGTPGRDKAFHDHSYRNLDGAGALEDHVAALRQLAETRPWLDLDRVGIFGRSGGGFATARAMLCFPEVFTVGVAQAGNHDSRFYHAMWAETYDGPYDDDAAARLSGSELAANLRGRLLLIHGEMDDNVSPHLTMRLVDALIDANKDFDLLIVPGDDHQFLARGNYVTRRTWDHLVRHLMGREPPAGYRLAATTVNPELRAAILR